MMVFGWELDVACLRLEAFASSSSIERLLLPFSLVIVRLLQEISSPKLGLLNVQIIYKWPKYYKKRDWISLWFSVGFQT